VLLEVGGVGVVVGVGVEFGGGVLDWQRSRVAFCRSSVCVCLVFLGF